MYGIFTYIGVVLGVKVGIYGSPMECLGIEKHITASRSVPRQTAPGPSKSWQATRHNAWSLGRSSRLFWGG